MRLQHSVRALRAPSRRRALATLGAAMVSAAGGSAITAAAGCVTLRHAAARRSGASLRVAADDLGWLSRASDVLLVRPGDGGPPLAVRRLGRELVVVVAVCTHRGCELDPHPDGYDCPCHGSSFDRRGRILAGPAEVALAERRARLDDGELAIDAGGDGGGA
jgi:Rieske Fe-S protein